MTAAPMAVLDGDRSARIDPAKINGVLLARLSAPRASDQARALALHMLQANHPRIAMQQLDSFLKSTSRPLQLESVRYLSTDSDPARFGLLAQTANDSGFDAVVRAEATLGLSDDAAGRVDLLIQLAQSSDAGLAREALRSLRPAALNLTDPQRQKLADIAREHPTESDLVDRA